MQRLLAALFAVLAVGAPAWADPNGVGAPAPTGKPIPALKPQTPEEAAYFSLTPLAATHEMQVQLQYTNIRPNGHSGSVLLRTSIWMPYVLFPGIQAANMGSIVILDLRFSTLHQPGVSETGINDINLFDLAGYQFKWGGLLFGPLLTFPAATSPLFGDGKLLIAPVFVVGITAVPHMIMTFAFSNQFSVAGAPDRAEVDRLVVVPIIGYALPRAFYLRTDPIWVFDWQRSGYATIPVNLSFGKAFTRYLTAEIEPEWVSTGDLKNSFTLRFFLSYLGW